MFLDIFDPLFLLTVFMTGVCGGMLIKTVYLEHADKRLEKKKRDARKEALEKALAIINSPLTDERKAAAAAERLKILVYIEHQRTSGGWSDQLPKFVFEQLSTAIQNGVTALVFKQLAASKSREVL